MKGPSAASPAERLYADAIAALNRAEWAAAGRIALDMLRRFGEHPGVHFVAGVAAMSYPRFAFYNVIGAVLWVVSLTTIGFLLGNTPWVKENFEWVALAMIIIPGLPAVFEVLRHTVFKRRAV